MDDNSFNNPFDGDEPTGSSSTFEQNGMVPLDENNSRRYIIWMLGGIIVLGCGFIFVAAFFFFQPTAKPLVAQYFPSPTPTSTATFTPSPTITFTPTLTPSPTLTFTPTITTTPHVLIPPLMNETVFTEQFETNDQNWYAYYSDNTTEVKDSRLVIRSDKKGYIGLALCTTCPLFRESFYFQAEVSSLTLTPESYGLAFCSSGYDSDFYAFQINPQTRTYDLYKHSAQGWETLLKIKFTPLLNKFPVTNILAVLFDRGTIELYINATQVNTYQDLEPLSCRRFGFYVNDGGFDMTVDNVFAYSIQPTATPTP